MKQKLKVYTFKYFILIVIFFSLIEITDVLRKVYFLSRDNYIERIGKNYSFCKGGAIPFLYFLKDKYQLNKKVEIYDYEINPDPRWVFFDSDYDNTYEDKLILLNYKKLEELKFFKLKEGLFVSREKPPYIFTLKKAIFRSKSNIKNVNLEISNRSEDIIQILLSKNFTFKNQSNEIDLNFDLENFNIRLGNLFIKILNDENNLENIEEINLELIPKYNLNDYKILEKTDNCYFLEKFS